MKGSSPTTFDNLVILVNFCIAVKYKIPYLKVMAAYSALILKCKI